MGFEAIIHNINDRPCFPETLPMSISYYRQIWVADMANRTIDTPYNIYSNKQWLEGWAQMLVPGAYERGIFGDLMLPGIACAIRKFILIFNTNLDTPHDPIYVVDPTSFNIPPDTEIPVVLAYNMSHYESMEPCTEVDDKMSTDLVKQYIEGRYRYSKQDMPYLLSNHPEGQEEKFCNEERRKIFRNETKVTPDKADLVEDGNTSCSEGMINLVGDNYKDDIEDKERNGHTSYKKEGKELGDETVGNQEQNKFPMKWGSKLKRKI